jgi:hypothetical protein
MITDGRYVFSFFAEGYGDYVFYFHFYPEMPVLGSVFYAGFANNGMNFAGTYKVEKKEITYAAHTDREGMISGAEPPMGTAPYTITFYDFSGNELDACGYDGEILYNDLTAIAGSGSGPVVYQHDTDSASKYAASYEAEAAVTYLDFVSPDDSTSTLSLFHNMTYIDLVNTMIEGTWSMGAGGGGGYDYTLTPHYAADIGAVLRVSPDKKEAFYAPDGGEDIALVTTAKDVSGGGEAAVELFSFTGAYTTLAIYTDSTYKFAFEASSVEEKGTWAFDKAAYQFSLTQENGNVITAAIDGDTHDMNLHYISVINEQLQDDFTAPASVWSVLTTFEPTTSAVLFSFTGGYTTLDILTDGTYKFAFEASSVDERGTWAFDKAAYQFSLTQENGNVITSTIESDTHDMSLHYVAVINEQLQDDFTAPTSTWSVLTQ